VAGIERDAVVRRRNDQGFLAAFQVQDVLLQVVFSREAIGRRNAVRQVRNLAFKRRD
jgi:hypothetical protein